MSKFLSLIVITLFISACASNTPQPPPLSDADQIATIVAGTLSAMPPTEIPATPTPPMEGFSINGQLQGTLAFIRNNNLWISVDGVETQLTNDATGVPGLWYGRPQISPDGTKIAYLKYSGYDAITLMVYDIGSRNINQFANITQGPWSNDSQKIYYPTSNGFDMTTGIETIVVKSINIATGEIQEHGQYGVQTGCGGGSSDPADGISTDENLRTSVGGGSIFNLSPQNNYIIHSITCQQVGLGILDLSTKQDRIVDENVTKAVISPDGSQIAAVSDNNIVIFNVVAGIVETTFPTSEAPRSLLWDVDGKEILYSTSRLLNEVALADNVALTDWASRSFKLNISTLWIVSTESGESRKIIELEAHDLKPIFTNGQRSLVVVIENSSKLFDYISQGNQENVNDYFPTVNIIEVDLTNSSSNLITNNTQQASFFK